MLRPVFRSSLAAIVAAVLIAAPAAAQKKAPAAKAGRAATGLESLERSVQEFTLANGLRFIVVERRQTPVFSFQTVVNSGSANDQVGTTGLAHMMEHMAFKGTERVGTSDYAAERPLLDAEERLWDELLKERRKGARADTAKLAGLESAFGRAMEAARAPVVSNGFTALLESHGAVNLNAFTAADITAYFYSLPSNRLELWALLEGGRMAHPVFREFYKERDVVIEERRMRYESSPIGRLYWEFITTAFIAHPYGFGGIGYPSDLRTFSRTEGEEFYRRHYVAKNMCVAVVGDVTAAEVKRVAEKYWSGLSDAPPPPPVDTEEPPQRAERRILLEDAAQPFVIIGWHIPSIHDPRYPAFDAAASLLGGGPFSRLHKRLVKEKKMCVQVSAGPGTPGEKYPSLFTVFAVPAAGQDPEAVEREIHAVIEEAMTTQPFTAEELAGYQTRTRSSTIGACEDNSQLAGALATAQMVRGDWREVFRDLERVQRLTPADLDAALESAIRRENRTVAMIVPPRAAAASEGGR